MNEKDKCTLSMVPYVTEKKHKEFFAEFFLNRKRMYLLFFAIFVFFFFFGLSYGNKFNDINIEQYISYFPKWLSVMTLIVYISVYTVFSPAVSIFTFSVFSVFIAFIYSYCNYALFPLFALMSTVSIVYFTEVFLCFNRAKYGIKQIFKPKSIISVSLFTIFFLIIILLLFRLV